MLTVGAKIKQIAGLAHTQDVSERDSQFIESIVEQSSNGTRTSHLSEKQVDWIEDIHERHFGRAQ